MTIVGSSILGHEPLDLSGRGHGLDAVDIGQESTAIEGSDRRADGRGLLVAAAFALLAVQVSGLGLQIGTISLRPEHLLPFLLILILVRRGRCGGNLPLVALLYAPFLWYLTVTLLGAPDAAHSLQSAVALLTATTALPCLLVLGEEIGGVRLLRLWLAVGTAVNGFGLALFATGLGGTQFDVTTGQMVVKGMAYEANIYGSQAGALLVAALTLPDFPRRRSGASVVLVNACALALSQARGAWVGFAVVLVLITMTRRIAVRRLLAFLAIVGIAGLLIFIISQLSLQTVDNQAALLRDLGTRAQSVTDTSNGTGAFRVRTWKLAMQDIREFPFAGSGINSYASLHGDFTRPGEPGYLANIYLGWLHDGGVIGSMLICLAILLYIRLLGGIHTAMTNPALYAMLVLGIAYVATDGSWIAWPWALAGIAFAYRRCQ
jgi:O-antigen ligase